MVEQVEIEYKTMLTEKRIPPVAYLLQFIRNSLQDTDQLLL